MRSLHRTGVLPGERSGSSASPIVLAWKDIRALRRAHTIKLLSGSGLSSGLAAVDVFRALLVGLSRQRPVFQVSDDLLDDGVPR
jgi:hypothetical protein